MNIALRWLRQHLDFDLDAEATAEILTSIGLEVESLETWISHPGGLEGLVVGEVLEVSAHPNADKLRLTRVNAGGPEPLPIVCGAPNVAAGQKVIVALPGATLHPSSGEPFTIKPSKIRGERSEGMICAEDEIGVGESHDGILVLPAETPVGLTAAAYFGVESDTIFSIGLTPNRPDAFSHRGVARDLYAALRTRGHRAVLRSPELPTLPRSAEELGAEALPIRVDLLSPEACPRYSGVVMDGLQVGPSPAWLQRLLASVGVRSINNVVDITNFILHEYGQPLHAFDYDAIGGAAVQVYRAQPGQQLVTLDTQTRELDAGDLVIADAEKPMCLAGIYGGLNSGVREQTQRLFLESACFEARGIRRSALRHGLRTDAASRFEKGCDPNRTIEALQRAVALLGELAGARLASPLYDIYPVRTEPARIPLRWEKLDRLIGFRIPQDEVLAILDFLGMERTQQLADGMEVAVPTDKPDVLREADLVEEILRIYGMDRIPLPSALRSSIIAPIDDASEQRRHRMATLLNGAGFSEIFSNPITRSRYLGAAGSEGPSGPGSAAVQSPAAPGSATQVVALANSLNAELDILRPDLVYGGLEAIARNVNRRRENLRLFEFGRVFSRVEGPQGEALREREQLGLWLCGNRHPESWRQAAAAQDYFDLKEAVALVLQRCGLNDWRQETLSEHPLLQFGEQYSTGGEIAVTFGRVSADLTGLFDLRLPVGYAAFNWDLLDPGQVLSAARYQPLSRFPAVRRDLALVLDSATAFRDVEALVLREGGVLLREVFLFDRYEGPGLGEGRKSYGLGLHFRDDRATLTDKQVDKVMQNLMKACEQELNATIRR
jgi:phenylalanyl-tRNA synthetase beta chain